jgi:hypothetical protein
MKMLSLWNRPKSKTKISPVGINAVAVCLERAGEHQWRLCRFRPLSNILLQDVIQWGESRGRKGRKEGFHEVKNFREGE